MTTVDNIKKKKKKKETVISTIKTFEKKNVKAHQAKLISKS